MRLAYNGGSNRYPGAGSLDDRNELRRFRRWLEKRGYSKQPRPERSDREALRMLSADRLVIVYTNWRQGYTVMERDDDLLRAFADERGQA